MPVTIVTTAKLSLVLLHVLYGDNDIHSIMIIYACYHSNNSQDISALIPYVYGDAEIHSIL